MVSGDHTDDGRGNKRAMSAKKEVDESGGRRQNILLGNTDQQPTFCI